MWWKCIGMKETKEINDRIKEAINPCHHGLWCTGNRMRAQFSDGNQLLEMQTWRSVGWRRSWLVARSPGRRFRSYCGDGGRRRRSYCGAGDAMLPIVSRAGTNALQGKCREHMLYFQPIYQITSPVKFSSKTESRPFCLSFESGGCWIICGN
jgi:hypothetical protein